MPYIHLNKKKSGEKLCKGNEIYYLSTPDKCGYSSSRSFVMLDLKNTPTINDILKHNICKDDEGPLEF